MLNLKNMPKWFEVDGFVVFGVMLLFCFVGLVAAVGNATLVCSASESKRVVVKDGSGSIIGYLDGQYVTDKNGNRLGYVRNGKTYDAKGSLVATPEVPGLLLCNCR